LLLRIDRKNFIPLIVMHRETKICCAFEIAVMAEVDSASTTISIGNFELFKVVESAPTTGQRATEEIRTVADAKTLKVWHRKEDAFPVATLSGTTIVRKLDSN
jgi:hypothetical protein